MVAFSNFHIGEAPFVEPVETIFRTVHTEHPTSPLITTSVSPFLVQPDSFTARYVASLARACRAVPFEPSHRLVSVGGVLSGAEEHHYNGRLDGLTFYDEALSDEQLRVLLGSRAARGCRVVDE